MSLKRIGLIVAGISFAGLVFGACSKLQPQAPVIPQAQSDEKDGTASAEASRSGKIDEGKNEGKSESEFEDDSPKMSDKDDVDSIDADLKNTEIKDENFK